MKKHLLLFLFLSVASQLHAQNLDWATTSAGSITGGRTTRICSDAQGMVYTAGYAVGAGTVGGFAVGTTPRDTTHYLSNLYGSSQQGGYHWLVPMPKGVSIGAIGTDGSAHLYVAGTIHGGTAEFGFDVLTAALSERVVFVAKYTLDGGCVWGKAIATSRVHGFESPELLTSFIINALSVHGSGSFSLTGTFTHQLSIGEQTIYNNVEQMFVAQCNAEGELMWFKQPLKQGVGLGYDISTDQAGNSYVTGTVDHADKTIYFENFEVPANGTNNDAFLAKYDASGECLWVRAMGSASRNLEYASAIATDGQGNSYVTGIIGGAASFGTITLTASETRELMFVAKYDPAGEVVWVKTSAYAPAGYMNADIALQDDKVFITGALLRSLSIEGQTVYNTKVSGTTDFFLAKFYTDGTFHWVARGGTGRYWENRVEEKMHCLAVGTGGRIYVGGTTTPGSFGTAAGNGPIFVAQFSDGACLLSGTVFNDTNGNGTMDAEEIPVKQAVIQVTPGPLYAASDNTGKYRVYVRPGTYSATMGKLPLYHQDGGTTHQVTFAELGKTDEDNHFPLTVQADVTDGRVTLSGDDVRPGFEVNQWVSIRNLGTVIQQGKVALALDPQFEYLSSEPQADVSGNVLTWEYTGLKLDEIANFKVRIKLPATVALGAKVVSTATLTPVGTDATTYNNTATLSRTVIGSYDPNDKAVSDSVFTPRQVREGEYLEYTIRFQNKGTAEAIFVSVKDTLSGLLEVSSLEMLGASHKYELKLSDKGSIEWYFKDIMLPAEMHNEPGSHGYIKYRIKPKASVVTGDAIQNKAYIFFDYNAPVITNTTLATIGIRSQKITFPVIGDKTHNAPAFVLGARASSTLRISYQVVAGALALGTDSAQVTGAGRVTIRASQAGNEDYHPATAEQTFCVVPAKPAIHTEGTESSPVFTLLSSSSQGNQWLRDGAEIAGATGPSYLITQAGSYAVRVTVNGCSSTSEAVALTATPSAAARELKVYPNPTDGRLRVQYPHLSKGGNVAVYSLLGVKLLEQPLQAQSGTWQAELDLSHLPAHSYLLKISGTSKPVVRLIHKQ